jgi:Fe-S-cluster-containing hydrogenase component 2
MVIKCDLCTHRANGSACVQVCPTNGLRLVDGETFENAKNAKEGQADKQCLDAVAS